MARQDDSDPAVRQRVYQSSRNALARMIAAAGAQPPAVINEQRVALENSINRIEAGYNVPPPPLPQPAPPPAPPRVSAPAAAIAVDEPRQAPPQMRREPVMVPPPPDEGPEPEYPESAETGYADMHDGDLEPSGDFGVSPDDAPVYRRRNGGFRRVFPILLLILLLAGAAWLTYSLVSTLVANLGQPAQEAGGAPANSQAQSVQDENVVYLTVLSPQDTSALQLEGRGRAEIVNQANTEMIRLTSVRPQGKRSEQADPILINLSEGVLSQLAGKDVTVEIQAKSGGAEPATFSIRCDFAGEDACGRKRFPAGLQPGTVIFTVPFPQDIKPGGKYSLLINTDVAPTSEQSAEGDPIDIISARLRYDK
ncbi:MAG: hypothetical protein MUE79_00480 [Nitratireductor sp.]|nr:hypothetical protein [Nitratireductor sp.]